MNLKVGNNECFILGNATVITVKKKLPTETHLDSVLNLNMAKQDLRIGHPKMLHYQK